MSETVKPSVCGVTCLHICAQSSHNGGLIPKYCGSYLYLWSTTISQQGRWSLHEAISESVAWQKTEKRNVVFSFVEKLENLQQPEITQLDLFVLCYDDRPGIKRSPDNLKTGELTTILLVCSSAASCIRLVSWLRYRWFSCSSRGAASLRGKHIKRLFSHMKPPADVKYTHTHKRPSSKYKTSNKFFFVWLIKPSSDMYDTWGNSILWLFYFSERRF